MKKEDNGVVWHDRTEHPENDGFYLGIIKIVQLNEYYYDIVGFKEGDWRFHVSSTLPIDISNIDRDYSGFSMQLSKWTELDKLNNVTSNKQAAKMEV